MPHEDKVFHERDGDATATRGEGLFIGVLDMFGFEYFESNGFDQLCINYANEKLQQLYVAQVFRAIQQEYVEEGITWVPIAFVDNAQVVQLIEGSGGVLAALDEETKLPGGSDQSYTDKLIAAKTGQYCFEPPRFGNESFTVQHFAGAVTCGAPS